MHTPASFPRRVRHGAGKSTLMRLISGEEVPDEGELTIGQTVALGYVNQNRDGLVRS